MKVSKNHPAAIYGRPVFLDDSGTVVGYREGLKALRTFWGWSRDELAGFLNVSPRTVESWEQGLRVPGERHLLRLYELMGED